jgi:uncharacterized protein (TIGR03083 family)
MKHDTVLQLYREGVEAIRTTTTMLDSEGWSRPACGTWDAADTARHVLAVARWYDNWLDRAVAGTKTAPFPESEIDEQNSRNIAALRDLDGPTTIIQFDRSATAYLDRAIEHWDLTYAYPYGTVTVGLHLGVAATEWHLHAFDLAHAGGRAYEPRDSSALFTAAGLCVAAAKPRLQRAVLHQLIPLGARSKPWKRLLRESGRKQA